MIFKKDHSQLVIHS